MKEGALPLRHKFYAAMAGVAGVAIIVGFARQQAVIARQERELEAKDNTIADQQVEIRRSQGNAEHMGTLLQTEQYANKQCNDRYARQVEKSELQMRAFSEMSAVAAQAYADLAITQALCDPGRAGLKPEYPQKKKNDYKPQAASPGGKQMTL